jgi:Domain of unknown function (DUF4440)
VINEELREIEDEWARVITDRDAQAAEHLLAQDFILSSAGGFGDAVSRDDWLGSLDRIETRALSCHVLDTRVFGEFAVVRARLQWQASFGERDLTGDYLVADVFRREDGHWRAVWRISTRLPES